MSHVPFLLFNVHDMARPKVSQLSRSIIHRASHEPPSRDAFDFFDDPSRTQCEPKPPRTGGMYTLQWPLRGGSARKGQLSKLQVNERKVSGDFTI